MRKYTACHFCSAILQSVLLLKAQAIITKLMVIFFFVVFLYNCVWDRVHEGKRVKIFKVTIKTYLARRGLCGSVLPEAHENVDFSLATTCPTLEPMSCLCFVLIRCRSFTDTSQHF